MKLYSIRYKGPHSIALILTHRFRNDRVESCCNLVPRAAGSTVTGHSRPCYVAQVVGERITIRKDQMGGVPCIRGLRIPVTTVVRMVANGLSPQEIVEFYPALEEEDVRAALLFAAEAAQADLPRASNE
jgi:uncharacterized protein (DUF433 family)